VGIISENVFSKKGKVGATVMSRRVISVTERREIDEGLGFSSVRGISACGDPGGRWSACSAARTSSTSSPRTVDVQGVRVV